MSTEKYFKHSSDSRLKRPCVCRIAPRDLKYAEMRVDTLTKFPSSFTEWRRSLKGSVTLPIRREMVIAAMKKFGMVEAEDGVIEAVARRTHVAFLMFPVICRKCFAPAALLFDNDLCLECA